MSDEETQLADNQLKVDSIPLVGASAALVAMQAGATLTQAAIALLYRMATGGLLTWYLR